MNKYPRGKFNQDDEGALRIVVTHKDNTVLIDFGKTVSWVGMDKDTALKLAKSIEKHANECKGVL